MEQQTPNQPQTENSTEENQFASSAVKNSAISQEELEAEGEAGEDGGLPPPEDENEATQINLSAIFGAFFILVFALLGIFLIFGSKRKPKAQDKDMQSAGSSYGYNFDIKDKSNEEPKPQIPFDNPQPEENSEPKGMSEEEMNDALKEFEKDDVPYGKAPVNAVGSGSSKVERPDTRNSKSPRKIEGIKGLENTAQNNQAIVNAALNGGAGSGSSRMTKDEYLAQMMSRTQQLQNQVYGSNNTGSGVYGSSDYDYQSNRENFFSNNAGGGAGNGSYLSYNSLWDGTIISGALVTAINTDNPGVVIARVTENVFSSYDHSFLLIPEGSLLYATYNSSVSYGQDSIQVAWNLLIRPDGYRVSLGNMNGVDAMGMSGYEGKVSNHNWQTLKAFGLIAMYSMIQTEMSNDIANTNNEYLQNAMTDVYTETKKLGNKIIDRALDIKPTITIKAGTEIKLITNIPLELPPVEIPKATQKYVRTR